MSDNLAVPESHEKNAIGVMFERESKREENLEKRALALARAARAAASKREGAAASPTAGESKEGKEGGNASGEDSPGGAAGAEVLDPATVEALGKIDATFRALLSEGGGGGGGGGGGDAAPAGAGDAKEEAK
jgi:hypothetical protein